MDRIRGNVTLAILIMITMVTASVASFAPMMLKSSAKVRYAKQMQDIIDRYRAGMQQFYYDHTKEFENDERESAYPKTGETIGNDPWEAHYLGQKFDDYVKYEFDPAKHSQPRLVVQEAGRSFEEGVDKLLDKYLPMYTANGGEDGNKRIVPLAPGKTLTDFQEQRDSLQEMSESFEDIPSFTVKLTYKTVSVFPEQKNNWFMSTVHDPLRDIDPRTGSIKDSFAGRAHHDLDGKGYYNYETCPNRRSNDSIVIGTPGDYNPAEQRGVVVKVIDLEEFARSEWPRREMYAFMVVDGQHYDDWWYRNGGTGKFNSYYNRTNDKSYNFVTTNAFMQGRKPLYAPYNRWGGAWDDIGCDHRQRFRIRQKEDISPSGRHSSKGDMDGFRHSPEDPVHVTFEFEPKDSAIYLTAYLPEGNEAPWFKIKQVTLAWR